MYLKYQFFRFLSEPSVEIVLDSSFADVTIISEDGFSKLEYVFGNNTDQIKKYTRYDGPFRVHEPGILNFRATKKKGFLVKQYRDR
ncbi:hypothetical protein Ct9H90mP29_20210 [bacterium]|nr:MAG: hypothetical protein Ct9H90mP29_20210 [bacterium]